MARCHATLAALALAVTLAAPAAAGDDAEARGAALAIYGERCGVEPGSARAEFARGDWDTLVAEGRDPDELRTLVEAIPADCPFVSFKQAVRGVERLAAGEDPFAVPVTEGVHLETRAQRAVQRYGKLGTRRPFVGLPQRFQPAWVFGAVNAGVACFALSVGVGTGVAASRSTEPWTGVSLALIAAPSFLVALIAGTVAIAVGAHVESHRVQDPSVGALGKRGVAVRLDVGPTGLRVRF